MIHCPNCNRLISRNNRFCPHCGVPLRQPQSMPPRQPMYHHHHFLRNTVIVILLCIIGVGGYGMYKNHMNSRNNTTSKVANNGQQNNSSNANQSSQQSMTNNSSSGSSNTMTKKANSQPANKPGYTLSKFPNNIQGTWYTYDQGKLVTLTITSDSMMGDGTTSPLHARPIHAKHVAKHPNWMICMPPRKVHGLDLVQTLGWNQGAGDGESFGVISYKGMTVLEEDGGAESWVDSNFFKSKAQAKQNKKKTLPHEIKRPGM